MNQEQKIRKRSIGLSFSEVLSGKKNINEDEVVLLTKWARKTKQHENIQDKSNFGSMDQLAQSAQFYFLNSNFNQK